jgi:hypothetical protein
LNDGWRQGRGTVAQKMQIKDGIQDDGGREFLPESVFRSRPLAVKLTPEKSRLFLIIEPFPGPVLIF